jgi:dienelactone hydrolase
MSGVTRIRSAVSLGALLATLLCILWLARLEASGPRRIELELDGAVPATLYLPESPTSLLARPGGASGAVEGRPPGVVLAHGIASDRRGMSSLARALTQAGYAVLTFDFRGHGANRNRFPHGRGSRWALHGDVRAAVDFLRKTPEVDGHRISVMGHSMGAGAALGYAEIDPSLDAAVLISGGRSLEGPHRPSNALFIYGEGDPERTRESAARLAAELAGLVRTEPGVVYGGFEELTAVTHVEVARADHLSILTSEYAARRIIGWLDDCYGVERGMFFLRSDPRLWTALLGLIAFLLVLPGLGDAVGRLSPRLAERPGSGLVSRLGMLAAALLATLPLVSVGDAASFLPLAIGNTVVVHLFAAGFAMLTTLLLLGRFDASSLRVGAPASLAAAALGIVAIYLLLTPLGAVLHLLSLTPERAVLALASMLLIVPFQVVFHYLLRRGGAAGGAVASMLGRIVVVAVLVVAVQFGVLSGVVMLMLPILALLFVVFEVVSSAIYARSRNWIVPALVESAWLAWIFAAVLPVSL